MKYIVELSQSELRAAVKALHLLLVDDTKNSDAKRALDALCLQSEGISKNPEKSGIFTNSLLAPKGCRPFPATQYLPVGEFR